MQSTFRPILLFLLAGLAGCAASGPARQVAQPPPEAPSGADPDALGHYIDAKRFEMAGQREAAVRSLRAAVSIDTTSATLYAALARNLLALRQFEEALEPGRRAARIEPQNAENRWLLYHIFMEGLKDTASAAEQLEAIARIDLDEFRAFALLLQIYNAQGRKADALRILDRAAAVAPARYQPAIAENYLRHGAPGKAAEVYRQVLADDPGQVQIWDRVGELALASGDTLGAARALRAGLAHQDYRLDQGTSRLWGRLIALYDTDARMDSLLSEVPLDTTFVERTTDILTFIARRPETDSTTAVRRNEQARALLDRLIREVPDRPDLLGRKGTLHLASGQPAEARAAFQKAVEIDPNARYWLGIAHAYFAEQDWGRAIPILEQLFDEAPQDARLYFQIAFDLGRAYSATERLAQAREVYRRASETHPDELRYPLQLARTYLVERAWEEAIPHLEALKERADGDPELLKDILYDLGHSYERAGRFDDAVAIFQRLLAQAPDHHQALNYLGYMFAEKGIRLDEAHGYIERALRAEPKNGAYLDSMGWVYYQKGRYAEAMKYLKLALEVEEGRLQNTSAGQNTDFLHENLSIIHDHAGDAARALGDLKAARRHWQRAAEFAPENEAIQKKLQATVPGAPTSRP